MRSKIDERAFNQAWETEYICARVKRIANVVKKGDFEAALDMLSMIRDKTEAARYLILGELGARRAKEEKKQD